MAYAICYKLKTPRVYNKGTKWETTESTFLARYGYSTLERTQAWVDELNSNPAKAQEFCAQQRLIYEQIECFFVNEQEEFDTSHEN